MMDILDEVCIDANTTRACKHHGIATRTFYDKLNKEADRWKPLYEMAVDYGTEGLINEARRRAYEGIDDAIYHKGDVVGFRKIYSDSLLMFLIKARRPEYRDRMFELPADGKFQLTINTEGNKQDPDGDG